MERKGQNSAEINNVEMNTHTEHKTISESGWCCCGQCRRFKDKEKHKPVASLPRRNKNLLE